MKLRPLSLAVLALGCVAAAGAMLGPGLASAQSPGGLAALARELAARIDDAPGRVLLLGLTDSDGATTRLERYLSDGLAAALTATGRVNLTDEAARRVALAEIRGSLADVIDPKTAQAAGRLAGAAWLLKGTAYVFVEARRAELHLQFIRVETGEYWQVAGPVPPEPTVLGLREHRLSVPAAPPSRPPLNLEMAVVASRPDGRGADIDLGVVREGDRLRSNDDIKVYFRTNAATHVYLVWVDPQGKATLQFPSRAAGAGNRVQGGVLHSAPEGNKWYYLDRTPGVETLYLLASYDPVADLAGLLRQAEAGDIAAAAARHELERLFADLRARGSAGVRAGPTRAVTGKGAAVSAEFSVVHGYMQAARRLSFYHDP